MAETKEDFVDQAMPVLLEGNDEERRLFIDQHQSSFQSLILSTCNCLITGTSKVKECSIMFLAKISEVEIRSILDILEKESAVYENVFSTIANFIHSSDKQPNPPESINYYLNLLINITRQEISDRFVQSLLLLDKQSEKKLFQQLQSIIINVEKLSSNAKDDLVHLIILLLLNLSQSSLIQKEIKDDKVNFASFLEMMLKFFEKSENPKTRSCCIMIIVNFLITGLAQEIILDPELRLIVKLLYPLAGPTKNELDDEDMAHLPKELQYLENSERVSDACLRDALISCLLLCCNTRKGRESLRSYGVYYILRELHKREEDPSIQNKAEDVVDILIKEEDEYDKFDDLLTIKIPDDLAIKFDKMDL